MTVKGWLIPVVALTLLCALPYLLGHWFPSIPWWFQYSGLGIFSLLVLVLLIYGLATGAGDKVPPPTVEDFEKDRDAALGGLDK